MRDLQGREPPSVGVRGRGGEAKRLGYRGWEPPQGGGLHPLVGGLGHRGSPGGGDASLTLTSSTMKKATCGETREERPQGLGAGLGLTENRSALGRTSVTIRDK